MPKGCMTWSRMRSYEGIAALLRIMETQKMSQNNEAKSFPDLMTEQELIEYLRIPEVTESTDYPRRIQYLKNVRQLPMIRLCRRHFYPLKAIREWVDKQVYVK